MERNLDHMSGPKLSAAEIEARRRAQLERERQERLRRLREAQNRYNTSKASVARLVRQLSELFNENIAPIQAVSMDGAETLTTTINQLLACMNMNTVENSSSEEAWDNAAIISHERALKLLEKGKALIEQEVARIGAYSVRVLTAARHASVSNVIENTVREDVQVQKSIEFSPVQQAGIEEHLSACLSELRQLLEQKQTPMKTAVAVLVGEIEAFIASEEFRQEKDLKRRIQDILNREQDLIDEIEECTDLYEEYSAISAIVNAEPLELAEVSGVEMLEQEIHDLQCRYQRKDEMDYIADQVNQVMLELGYEFVSSHVLQQETEKDMSVYGVDEKTGVVIYTGENGEVMMQVVGFGDTEEMSTEEIEESLDLQLSFCAAHQDIVEELKKKGILLRQVNYESPGRKHARKICIAGHSQESRRAVKRRKRRYEPGKAMRKM